MVGQEFEKKEKTSIQPQPEEFTGPADFRSPEDLTGQVATIDEYNEVKTALNIIDKVFKVEGGEVHAHNGKHSAYQNLVALENQLSDICNPNPLGPGSRIDNFKSQPDKVKALEALRDAVSKARQNNDDFQLNGNINIPIAVETYEKAVDFLRELQNVHEGKKA